MTTEDVLLREESVRKIHLELEQLDSKREELRAKLDRFSLSQIDSQEARQLRLELAKTIARGLQRVRDIEVIENYEF